MFNLIVSDRIENECQVSIHGSRVFEYTDEHLINQFKPSGELDVLAVTTLPTILMGEGTSNEIVSIGYLSQIKRAGQDYNLLFTLDPDTSRMTNASLLEIADDLQIENFEFSRNHWAVKDVDLFKVLYQRKSSPLEVLCDYEQTSLPRFAPTVFQLSNNPVVPNLISMMMPFSDSFNLAYQTVKSAIEAKGYQCRRADDFWVHPHIMQDVVELICTSRVVICDLSEKNPNVFYETGITHSLGKDFILVTQSMDHVPFDLRALRCIAYANNQQGYDDLAHKIIGRLNTLIQHKETV